MDIWKLYCSDKMHKNLITNSNTINKYIKKRDNTYDEIRTHVLETPETKENHLNMVIGNLTNKNYKYKNLIFLNIFCFTNIYNGSYSISSRRFSN